MRIVPDCGPRQPNCPLWSWSQFKQRPVGVYLKLTGLTERGIGLKVLTGKGAAIDTTTASGKLVFGIFAALAEFERELISERTLACPASARARGRNGGRPYKMTPAKLRLAMASMGKHDTNVSDLCTELGITRPTLYPARLTHRDLRPDGEKAHVSVNASIAIDPETQLLTRQKGPEPVHVVFNLFHQLIGVAAICAGDGGGRAKLPGRFA
jgi:hypothetical protein